MLPGWLLASLALLTGATHAAPLRLRVATYNVSLNRENPGALATDLRSRTNAQASRIAAVLQKVRPDVVLLNEFDHDPTGASVRDFQQQYLGTPQHGQQPLSLPHAWAPAVNTGVSPNRDGQAVHDFNRDGQATHAPPAPSASPKDRNAYGGDCFGFGTFPGQYGLVVLSRFQVRTNSIRTFQKLLWKDMPGAVLPDDPATPALADWYRPEDVAVLRLSSKTHADIPIELPTGSALHVLASHPTPPVFDGPEDRNGRRNHDEIRFWADYIRGDGWMHDDNGRAGGLPAGTRFVVLGDLNADPQDGDSFQSPARLLLDHPGIASFPPPRSPGAVEATRSQGANNLRHKGDPAHDTGDFADRGNGPGNLRIDYVLPSRNGFKVLDSGVFWPGPTEPGADWVEASDHRLVWVDLEITD